MLLKVAVYLRISQKEKKNLLDESNSIQNQRKILFSFIKKDEILYQYPVEEYCDDGYSGTHFNRPAVQRLLEDIQGHKIYAIIVKDFSRFSRDYIELGTFREMIFPMNNIRFISLKDDYDSLKEMTDMLGTATSSLVYDLYSKDLSVKLKSVFETKCQNGEYPFGSIPLGYVRAPNEKGGVRETPEEAKIVRRIFDEAYQGIRICRIARRLNEDGIPTYSQIRKRKTRADYTVNWTSTTVRGILKNRFYIGELVYNKKFHVLGNSKRINLPKEEWKVIKDHHKGLIPEEIFQAVQIEEKAAKTRKQGNPFSGKVFCGGCGHSMKFRRMKNIGVFACGNSLYVPDKKCCTYFRGDILEEMLLYRLNQEILIWMDQIRLEMARQKELLKKKEALKTEISELDKEKQTLLEKKRIRYEAYVFGDLDKAGYFEENGLSEEKLAEITEKLLKLRSAHEQVVKLLKNIKPEAWDILREMNTAVLSQELIDCFVEKIVMYHDKRVEIIWKFKPVYQPIGETGKGNEICP